MDDLIRRKATGNPDQFCRKVNLSRRALMGYLQAMKFLGFPIKYDKTGERYYYETDGRMTERFFEPLGRELNKEDQKKINGGYNISDWCNNNALWKNNFTLALIHCRELSLGEVENL